MGRLIIDGNSVFEIDEECLKRRKPAAECEVDKYFLPKELLKKEEFEKNTLSQRKYK